MVNNQTAREAVAFLQNIPKTKLSGLKIWPNGPDLTESIVPGSKSTRMALGTYLPPGIYGESNDQMKNTI